MITRPILFITGLSGAGISTTLKALEDCGYEVFDNFPLTHIESVLHEPGHETKPIAFGFDARTRDFHPDALLESAHKHNARILFLSASNNKIQQRFSETRRTHPMAKDRTVLDGIIRERELVEPLLAHDMERIDTSELGVHDLKRLIQSNYSPDGKGHTMVVTIMSFGYKHGTPREADIIMDVRFLTNPHWEETLRELTGKDQQVSDYIEKDQSYSQFMANFKSLIEPLIPRYSHEGKHYLTIAFGCTGGRHRSVHTAEKIGAWLSDTDINVHIKHRDLKD